MRRKSAAALLWMVERNDPIIYLLRCTRARIAASRALTNRLFLSAEVEHFLEANGYHQGVVRRCGKSREVEAEIERLGAYPNHFAILAITLQTFPHIKRKLSPELRCGSMVFANVVHRSHADKSLSEELDRVLGAGVRLRMFRVRGRLYGDLLRLSSRKVE